MERQVAAVVDLMNPSVLGERTSCRREVREFLAYGGVEVALADQRLTRSEMNACCA